jgi:hypothetical protein
LTNYNFVVINFYRIVYPKNIITRGVFTFLAASVFATPLVNTEVPTANVTDKEIDLFADVEAVPLAEMEMSNIEGTGWFGALIGSVVGSVFTSSTTLLFGADVPTVIFAGALGVAGGAISGYNIGDSISK